MYKRKTRKKKRSQLRRTVYFAIVEPNTLLTASIVKIGFTWGSVSKRINGLDGCPFTVTKIYIKENVHKLEEGYLHRKFKASCFKGEWFILSDEIQAYIEDQLLTVNPDGSEALRLLA
jgi:hypothetical protein